MIRKNKISASQFFMIYITHKVLVLLKIKTTTLKRFLRCIILSKN